MDDLDLLLDEEVRKDVHFPFWKIIYKNLLFIIITVIIITGVFIGASALFVKPVYSSSQEVILKLALDNGSYATEQQLNNNSLAKNYLPTVVDLVKSPKTVELARSYNNLDISVNIIEIIYKDESLIFEISYKDSNIESAEKKLNDLLKASESELYSNTYPFPTKNIELVKTQNKSFSSVNNKMKLFIIAGVVSGITVALCYVLLKYVFDNKLKTEEDVEELTKTDILSVLDK